MQHRMKEFSMTPEATLALLRRGQVGVLSTSGADGAPYGVPVHYLWQDGKLWFHGLPAGEKLENIARDHRVCFYRMGVRRNSHRGRRESLPG